MPVHGQTRIAAALTLLALTAGCDRTTLQTVESVPSAGGTDRLIRRDWETVSFSRPGQKSYDSHSLVWQRLQNGSWSDIVTITQADFQRGTARRRWFSSIHSFDAVAATAIIKVAEAEAPDSAGTIQYVYSWREWDIKNNREIKTIRVCKDPFEPCDAQRP